MELVCRINSMRIVSGIALPTKSLELISAMHEAIEKTEATPVTGWQRPLGLDE